MPFFLKLKNIFINTDWISIIYRLQKITAYLPVVLVPWIFSPISTDPFYVEKIVSIFVFSTLSLIFFFLKNFLQNFDKKSNSKNKKNNEETKPFYLFYSPSIKYFFLVLAFVFISQMFSVNFNLSFYGVGTFLFLGMFLWLIAINQVFDRSLFKVSFVSGITIVSVIDLILLITRFHGAGVWSFVNSSEFTPNWGILSLIFILFVSIYFSLTDDFKGKYRYFFISSLFINSTVFIIYSYFVNFFVLSYISLALIFFVYFVKGFQIKLLPKKKGEKVQKKRFSFDTSLYFKIVIVLAAIFVGVFEIFLQNSVIIPQRNSLPSDISWTVTVKTLTDNPKNFLVGTGANSYNYAFLHYKPEDINKTPYWSNIYFVALNSIFEIFTNFGIAAFLSIFSFLFYKKLKYYKKNKIKLKGAILNKFSKEHIISTLGFLFITLLFLITPFTLVNVWILFMVMVYLFVQPKKYELKFEVLNEKNTTKNLFHYFNSLIILVILIPFLYVSVIFYLSSVLITWGGNRENVNRIEQGVSLFPFYNKNLDSAINYGNSLSNLDKKNQISANVREYGKMLSKLNSNDPLAYLSYLNSLNVTSLSQDDYTVIADIYSNLNRIAPNHLPYYLSLSDILVQGGDNKNALNIINVVLSKSPNLDIALIKKANILYLQYDFTNAQAIAQQVKDSTKDENIRSAADNILEKISSVK